MEGVHRYNVHPLFEVFDFGISMTELNSFSFDPCLRHSNYFYLLYDLSVIQTISPIFTIAYTVQEGGPLHQPLGCQWKEGEMGEIKKQRWQDEFPKRWELAAQNRRRWIQITKRPFSNTESCDYS